MLIKSVAFFFIAATLFFSGCAETSHDGHDQVSAIPWNRPEKWEGQGMTPGFTGTY